MTISPGPTRSRRAVALLLVLAALVVAVTACTAIARMAATASVADRAESDELAVRQILRSADPVLRDWLLEHSGRATVAPESVVPEFPVFAARWRMDEESCSLAITAYDLRGALPIAAVLAGSPLRRTLRPEVLSLIDQADLPENEDAVYGLDLLAKTAVERGLRVFPRPAATEFVLYGDAEPLVPQEERPLPPLMPALGTFLSSHTGEEFLPAPEESSRLLPLVRLNVNTAPMPLIEEALRLSGRGGIELISSARSKGRPAPLPPPVPDMIDRGTMPELVGSSDLWAFRIDARRGIVRKSVWAVYLRTAADWECIQRLAVTD